TKGRTGCWSGAVLRSSLLRSLLAIRAGLRPACAGPTMPSADSAPGISADDSALSQFPSPAPSHGTGEVSRGKSWSFRRVDARCTKHTPSEERTALLRANSSQACHAWYRVPVRRPASSFHASFRHHLAVVPLRFPSPSASPAWREDFHLRAPRHARHTRQASAAAGSGRLHTLVRLSTFHWAGEWNSLCFGRLCPLAFLRTC